MGSRGGGIPGRIRFATVHQLLANVLSFVSNLRNVTLLVFGGALSRYAAFFFVCAAVLAASGCSGDTINVVNIEGTNTGAVANALSATHSFEWDPTGFGARERYRLDANYSETSGDFSQQLDSSSMVTFNGTDIYGPNSVDVKAKVRVAYVRLMDEVMSDNADFSFSYGGGLSYISNQLSLVAPGQKVSGTQTSETLYGGVAVRWYTNASDSSYIELSQDFYSVLGLAFVGWDYGVASPATTLQYCFGIGLGANGCFGIRHLTAFIDPGGNSFDSESEITMVGPLFDLHFQF